MRCNSPRLGLYRTPVDSTSRPFRAPPLKVVVLLTVLVIVESAFAGGDPDPQVEFFLPLVEVSTADPIDPGPGYVRR